MKDCIIASISDVHLGHRKTPTRYIVNNLNEFLLTDKFFEKLNLLFIVGDFFDHLLELNYEDLPQIDSCIARIFYLCEKHNVILYVLEGTPSHDRLQSERFVTIHTVMQSKTRFKYIKTIDTDYIPEYDCQILFIPDEISPTHEETLEHVKELMQSKGIKAFDIALMHGLFPHQIPQGIKIPCHDYNAYHDLVNNVIFIGHHHTHSVYKKAIAQGSFDRLKHGEEEKKGFVRVHVKDNKTHTFFIENKKSYPYITIDCTDLTLEDVYERLSVIDSQEDFQSYIRLQGPIHHPAISSFNDICRHYQLLSLTKDIKEVSEVLEQTDTIEEDIESFESIEITSSNIIELLMQRLRMKSLTQSQLSFIEEQLNEVRYVT